MYQSLIRRRRDQGFKIYKLKGNLSWLRVLQTVCNLYFYYYYYYYFIIIDEFESMIWNICLFISVLNLYMSPFFNYHQPIWNTTNRFMGLQALASSRLANSSTDSFPAISPSFFTLMEMEMFMFLKSHSSFPALQLRWRRRRWRWR